MGVQYGDNLGYEGLGQSLVIEFDMVSNVDKGDPTYPHISV